MEIKEKEIKNSTALVEVLVSSTQMDHTKEEVVDEMIQNLTVKGFRQGKAPKSIAQKNLDPEKLSNHIFSHVLNASVREVLEKQKYKMLGRPVLEKVEPQKDGSLQITLRVPLYPDFKLNDYQKAIKKIKSKEKKVEEIYDTLLKTVDMDVSPVLVDQEADYSYEKLENHAKSLNLPTEKYLEAIKKTKDEVQKEYKEKATEAIKLDIILLEIAEKENITTSKEEIAKMAQISQLTPDQETQLKSIIVRRKTIDYLMQI